MLACNKNVQLPLFRIVLLGAFNYIMTMIFININPLFSINKYLKELLFLNPNLIFYYSFEGIRNMYYFCKNLRRKHTLT
jgi:hypothetical protein